MILRLIFFQQWKYNRSNISKSFVLIINKILSIHDFELYNIMMFYYDVYTHLTPILREIKKYQKSIEFLIFKLLFVCFVREFMKKQNSKFRIQIVVFFAIIFYVTTIVKQILINTIINFWCIVFAKINSCKLNLIRLS